MSKAVKELVVAELKKRFDRVQDACVVDITGLTVQETEKLRRTLRTKSARMQIVKNSLARLAFKGTNLEPLSRSMQGPCALVTTKESIIDVAKLLVKSTKDFTKLKLKNALVEASPDLAPVDAVSKMRGKREVLGELAMLIASPGRAIAGCIGGPQARIAGCVKAIADKV